MTEKLSDEFTKRFHDVEENYKVIQERMAEAAVKSGRNPQAACCNENGAC